MIVDDERDILDLLARALNIEGFKNIIKIDNGISAIASCQEQLTGYNHFGCNAARYGWL